MFGMNEINDWKSDLGFHDLALGGYSVNDTLISKVGIEVIELLKFGIYLI